MKYLQLYAAGHALLIEAERVAQVGAGAAGLDLCLRLGAPAPGTVVVACTDGPSLAVDRLGGLVEHAHVAAAPWLPAEAAALLDGLAGGAWRLRRGLA